MIQIENLTVTHQSDLRDLIKDLNLVVNAGDKLALIGEEGSGKSTLLKLLLDQQPVENYALIQGKISNSFERIGYLPQQLPLQEGEKSIQEYLYQNSNDDFFDYNLLYRLSEELNLDSQRFDSTQKMSSLSGGEKLKFQLIKMLICDPNLLLLDEPSNDLDLQSIKWLENFIKRTNKTVIFISHDEALLSAVATKIVHFEHVKKKKQAITGVYNYDYQTYKTLRQATFEKNVQLANKEREEHQERIAKLNRTKSALHHDLNTTKDSTAGRLLAKKMKAIKSQERRFQKTKQTFTEIPYDTERINLSFYDVAPLSASKVVLAYDNQALQKGEGTFPQRISLTIFGQDKVGIIGDNGVGKTTLLKQMWNDLRHRNDLSVGYMPQNYEKELDAKLTPIDFLEEVADNQTVKSYLASLQFTREEIEHPASELSGGQKAKLFLARLVLSQHNVLLLDEPTRNISPNSQEEIRKLFQDYQGCIISVSHDRAFLDEVTQKVYELSEKGIK